jgi:hypothetical protein
MKTALVIQSMYNKCGNMHGVTLKIMKIAVFWDMMLHKVVKRTDVQRILLPSLSVLMLEVVGSPEI